MVTRNTQYLFCMTNPLTSSFYTHVLNQHLGWSTVVRACDAILHVHRHLYHTCNMYIVTSIIPATCTLSPLSYLQHVHGHLYHTCNMYMVTSIIPATCTWSPLSCLQHVHGHLYHACNMYIVTFIMPATSTINVPTGRLK